MKYADILIPRLDSGLITNKWANEQNLLFINENGRHLEDSTVYRPLKEIVSRIRISENRFHDLQYTYATLVIMGGQKSVIIVLQHTKTNANIQPLQYDKIFIDSHKNIGYYIRIPSELLFLCPKALIVYTAFT